MRRNNSALAGIPHAIGRFFDHLFIHSFILATSAAAFVHSAWTINYVFTGNQDLNFENNFLAALVACMVAFSFDVGQVRTSSDIKNGQRTRWKYGTFVVFAVATYYLQWIYVIHHMPKIAQGPGVRADWAFHVQTLLDIAIWVAPGLLPLSTLMYTFSQSADKQMITTAEGMTILIEKNEVAQFDVSNASKLLAAGSTDFPGISNLGDGKYEAVCDKCGWKRVYTGDDPSKAASGLRSHKGGTACKPQPSPEKLNGNLKIAPTTNQHIEAPEPHPEISHN